MSRYRDVKSLFTKSINENICLQSKFIFLKYVRLNRHLFNDSFKYIK